MRAVSVIKLRAEELLKCEFNHHRKIHDSHFDIYSTSGDLGLAVLPMLLTGITASSC